MITIYDTAVGSLNIGDQIIMDAVMLHLEHLFPSEQFVHYPTHYALAQSTLKKAWENELAFVGGTNLLRNYWRFRARKNQWSLGFFDASKMQPAILMGVGWNAYADYPERKAQTFYRKALRTDILHSVRDSYTLDKLKQCGIENVINTGCPTLWQLDKTIQNSIPSKKSSQVVFTLTDYSKDEQKDLYLIRYLKQHYEKIYFWAQGSGDNEYFRSLSVKDTSLFQRIEQIPSNLNAYNQLLLEQEIDFIGTRLHAGIRALQNKRRAIIIGVDNRAIEMQKDFNLPVVTRDEIGKLASVIEGEWAVNVHLPIESIERWKVQFIPSN